MVRRTILSTLAALAVTLSACDTGDIVGPSASESPERAPLVAEATLSVLTGAAGQVQKEISQLWGMVASLQETQALTRREARGLQWSLRRADFAIRRDRFNLALVPLRTFQFQVDRLVTTSRLSPNESKPLLDAIARIRADLSSVFACPDPELVREKLEASFAAERANPGVADIDVRVLETPPVVGEPLTFATQLATFGQPLFGADVQAVVRTPTGACLSFRLVDDGTGADETASDGRYTARYTSPALAGVYALFVTADGVTGQDEAFARARLLAMTVRIEAESNGPGPQESVVFEFPRPGLLFNPLIPPLVLNF